MRTAPTQNKSQLHQLPGIGILSLLVAGISSVSLGVFIFEWIKTPENYPYYEQIGRAWLEGVAALLPAGGRVLEKWNLSSLSGLAARFPFILLSLLAGIGFYFAASMAAAWQNCLILRKSLFTLGWVYSPLLFYLLLTGFLARTDHSVPAILASLPLSLSLFLFHQKSRALQREALPGHALLMSRHKVSGRIPSWIVGGMALLMFFAWFRLSCLRHQNFQSQGYDLALMSHIFNRLILGEGLTSSLIVAGGSFLGHHFSPLLYLLAPLYYLCPHPEVLLGVQAASIGLAAWSLYRLGQEVLGSAWAACAMALAYLFLPGLSEGVFSDFHAICLAPPLFFWLALEALRGDIRRVWIPLAGVLLVQENLFLYTLSLGLLLGVRGWWSHHQVHQRMGLLIGSVSLAYGVAAFSLIQPWLLPEGVKGYGFVQRYVHLLPEGSSTEGLGLGELILGLIRHPAGVFSTLFESGRLEAFAKMWGGILFLPLWNPMSWILLPPFLENSLAKDEYLYSFGGHYAFGPCMVTGVMLVFSFAVLKKMDWTSRKLAPIAWSLLACSIFWSLEVSQLPISRKSPGIEFGLMQAPAWTDKLLHTAIPMGKSVSAQSHLLPHLTYQNSLYLLPPSQPEVRFVEGVEMKEPQQGWPDVMIMDEKAVQLPYWYNLWFYDPDQVRTWVHQLEESRKYRRINQLESLVILERVQAGP